MRAQSNAPTAANGEGVNEQAAGDRALHSTVADEAATALRDALGHPTRTRALRHGLAAIYISHHEQAMIVAGLLPDPAGRR